jgi:hypothetical protein
LRTAARKGGTTKEVYRRAVADLLEPYTNAKQRWKTTRIERFKRILDALKVDPTKSGRQ